MLNERSKDCTIRILFLNVILINVIHMLGEGVIQLLKEVQSCLIRKDLRVSLFPMNRHFRFWNFDLFYAYVIFLMSNSLSSLSYQILVILKNMYALSVLLFMMRVDWHLLDFILHHYLFSLTVCVFESNLFWHWSLTNIYNRQSHHFDRKSLPALLPIFDNNVNIYF